MNVFRSQYFLRAAVFLLVSVLMTDSIVTSDEYAAADSSTEVVVKAADEHDGDNWGGRFSGAENNLCKEPVYQIELVVPYTVVTINFSGVADHFKSVPSELPSPPPRG